jgi:hypothetical protein
LADKARGATKARQKRDKSATKARQKRDKIMAHFVAHLYGILAAPFTGKTVTAA